MTSVNSFTHYTQLENHFTNALIGLLSLSRAEDAAFVNRFFHEVLGIHSASPFQEFRVLEGIKGTADGEVVSTDCCVHFETKIASATLRKEQIRSHLLRLRQRTESVKRLVLLTPDDSSSNYVSRFRQIDDQIIVHLEWKRIHKWLEGHCLQHQRGAFVELLRQFLATLKAEIFEADYMGIVLKVDFGDKSEVYDDAYLDELRNGVWRKWNTPREYKQLDGTGRKLLLYDRTRKAITAEVVIREVKKTFSEANYPWTNFFEPNTLVVYQEPIPVEHVRTLPGFENFGVYRKDRSAYRNLTHEQYRLLRQAAAH